MIIIIPNLFDFAAFKVEYYTYSFDFNCLLNAPRKADPLVRAWKVTLKIFLSSLKNYFFLNKV